MAIEDAYELANNLEDAMRAAGGDTDRLDFSSTFVRYQVSEKYICMMFKRDG